MRDSKDAAAAVDSIRLFSPAERRSASHSLIILHCGVALISLSKNCQKNNGSSFVLQLLELQLVVVSQSNV